MTPERITPLILTCNEEHNIARCLSRLHWASQVVVVDSGSTDATESICRAHRGLVFLHRPFDSFAAQSNFGMSQVRTPWVLSLDADYLVPAEFLRDAAALGAFGDLAGASARFRYRVMGRQLAASLYPPRIVLHRTSGAVYMQDGHAHRVCINGKIGHLKTPFDHDDRKPLGRWFDSQQRYASEEADKLANAGKGDLALADRIRLLGIPAPVLVGLWCLLWKRCALEGWSGWYYTMQRVMAEMLLALELADRRLRHRKQPRA